MVRKKDDYGDIGHFDDDPEELLWRDDIGIQPVGDEKYESMLAIAIDALKRAEPSELPRVVQALTWFRGDERLLEPLREMLYKPETRLHAIRGMGVVGLAEGVDELMEIVEESPGTEAVVIEEAIISLGMIGFESSIPLLYDLMAMRERPDIAEANLIAVEALLRVAENDPDEKSLAFEAIRKGSKMSNPETVEACLAALKVLNEKDWSERGYLTIEAEFSVEGPED